jgi:putative CocE/NonD family hydrolase
MGENVWRDEDDWPLPRARSTRFFIHSDGKANTAAGDGLLDTECPRREGPDRFTFDPVDLVPTHVPARDQREVETREDVLVYTTKPLEHDLEVTGPVELDLYTSSSAADTDFTAKLVDVFPDGLAVGLADGIIRARYRNSPEKPELMTPGRTYRMTVDLWATSNLFRAGHRLRLEISSSNFPRFERNLNTGEDQARAVRMVKAVNSIYHDPEHPTALVLPVVPW